MSTPRPIKLFNTLSRSVETLAPIAPPEVTLYCCGPTVYNYQHIGNMRAYLFEDILARAIRFAGYQIRHVMNITDVGHLVSDEDSGEDKMLVAARREKLRSFEIAERYTAQFFEDCARLHIVRPSVVCKATDHIAEMIELIQRIEKRGFTYVAGGNVYFDVARCPDYGELARLDLPRQLAGVSVQVDPNKRNPQDFVLWFTKSKFENQELQWDSPWGRGYPGWHIECSAMSMRYLGEHFDIHCGGVDHVTVHHTNEIAQSEAATGKRPWVNIWMHCDWLMFNDAKISKSAGTFILVKDLIERGIDPLALRYFCLTAHYRKQISFSWDVAESGNTALKRLREQVIALKNEAGTQTGQLLSSEVERFSEAILNDLNTAQALAVLWELLGNRSAAPADKLATLYHFDQVLGLGLSELSEVPTEIPESIRERAQARDVARSEKNWAKADEIRKEIESLGFSVKDSPKGTIVTKS